MASSARLIRRRIKSVSNTRKITKAMELVAASKMRKSISAVLATRPYADSAWRAVSEIAKVTDAATHPLLKRQDEPGKSLVIVFTSDRGLCGGLNSRLIKTVGDFVRHNPAGVDFVSVGKKGFQAVRRHGWTIVASFADLTNRPRYVDVVPVAKLAMDDFLAGVYASVHLAFTDYRSALVQEPVVRQLLPIVRIKGLGTTSDEKSAEGAGLGSLAEHFSVDPAKGYEYTFEPSPETVLDTMLPRIVETQVYQSLLESSASEHSARMMAMRAATDNAGEMIGALTLALNQARQAGITMEIAEISSGRAALER